MFAIFGDGLKWLFLSSFSYFYIFSLVFMEMVLISLLICWRAWLSFGMVLGWGCWCELFEFVFFCCRIVVTKGCLLFG